MKNVAIEVAIAEILQPTLGVTEQVLAVHKLASRDGNPSILRVDEEREVGAYYLYFAIEGEPYYFVIVVREEQETLVASAAYIEAAVGVYLAIASLILTPDEITEKVNLMPTRKPYLCGVKFPQLPHLKSPTHRWYFEPQKEVPDSLENKLNDLLDCLEPVREKIAGLQDCCEIWIGICYESYRGWMGGWHLDKITLQRITALGAEIDLDLYAFGKEDLPC